MLGIKLEDLKPIKKIFKNNKVTIKSAIVKQTHLKVCVKTLKSGNIDKLNKYIVECMSIARFTHPHVYKLFSTLLTGENRKASSIAMITEYLENGDLLGFIKARKKSERHWKEETLFYYASQLTSALSYMQEQAFAHRDIKPENILITAGGKELKICDFGLTCKVIKKSMTINGTESYLSPILREAYMQGKGDDIKSVRHDAYKSDVFSLGLIFLFMASFKDPTGFKKLRELNENIQVCIADIENRYPNFGRFLRFFLEYDENYRLDFIALNEALKKTRQFTPNEYCIYCQDYFCNFSFKRIYDSIYCQDCVIKVHSSNHKCSLCKAKKEFQDVYIFETKIYCRSCLDLSNFRTLHLYCSLCRNDLKEYYLCECINLTRCQICKIFRHPGKNCLENSSEYVNFQREALLMCSCNELLAKTKNIYFYQCKTENKNFCWVCGESMEDDHTKCSILLRFSQYIEFS